MTTYGITNNNSLIEKTLSVDLPPSQAYLILDSKNRQNNEPITNMTITKNGGYFSMSKPYMYALNYVNFPWWIRNCTSRNNKISVLHVGSGTTYNSTIPIGFYNVEQFAPALQAALNSGGYPAPFTVTINADNTITVSSAAPFVPLSSGQDRSPLEMVGMKIYTAPVNIADSITTHTGIPQLYYTRYVDLISDHLNKSQYIPDEVSNSGASNILVRLSGDDGGGTDVIPPANFGSGGIITRPHRIQFGVNVLKWVRWASPHAGEALGGTIDIRIIDEYGKEAEVMFPTSYPDFSLGFVTRSLE